jgi:uncharacterized membrane protein YdjX (TVP38/TMEM64 family)
MTHREDNARSTDNDGESIARPLRRLARPLLLIAVVLLVPIVPFVVLGERFERRIDGVLASPPAAPTVILLVVGLLATDVFLPVPSSLVSTLAGGQLSLFGATAASWVGLTLGASLGYVVGKRLGRPLAERLTEPQDLQRMEPLLQRHGTFVLVVTRALPILAEATVLLVGVHRLGWRRFLPPVLLSNLGIALAYSALGRYSAEHKWLPAAMAISVALPLILTAIARRST